MTDRLTSSLLILAVVLLLPAVPAQAGGFLETIDITAGAPSPIPGHIVAPLVRIRWDERCIPVQYSMNDTLDPIPNPLGAPFLSVADAQATLQADLDKWNAIPTSYIESQITGTISNPGLAGFDLTNELTFRTGPGFGAIAVSPSTSLIADSVFVDGDDIDGDGDSDVAAGISTCTDVDSDGDIEFPEGTYPAGTILDNDVSFNSTLLRFTIADADIDPIGNSTDLSAIATHEFGHSHGLSHVLDNQLDDATGVATVMFPFIDTGDPAAELGQRTLREDDIAHSSFYYPEGTAGSGPAALQFGDFAFDWIYGVLEGEVTHGSLGGPVAGASVAARRLLGGRLAAAAFSGTVQLSFDPGTGGLFLVSPAFNIIDGRYQLPLPLGVYRLHLEATDGNPVSSSSISFAAQVGDIFGQQNFNEELYNGNHEGAIEREPGFGLPTVSIPGQLRTGHDFVTNVQAEVAPFAAVTNIGFTGAAPGLYYAVRIPAADVAALDLGNGLYIQAGEFFTFVADASVVPVFAEATLTTGSVSGGTVTVDLANPLRRESGFIGQDGDFTPFYFDRPKQLGTKVLRGINDGDIEDLFLVLRVTTTTPFPGVSGFPPLIGLSAAAPFFGQSYTSTDGVNFAPSGFDFTFKLVTTPR